MPSNFSFGLTELLFPLQDLAIALLVFSFHDLLLGRQTLTQAGCVLGFFFVPLFLFFIYALLGFFDSSLFLFRRDFDARFPVFSFPGISFCDLWVAPKPSDFIQDRLVKLQIKVGVDVNKQVFVIGSLTMAVVNLDLLVAFK